eukprot:gene25593-biopygen10523
MLEGGHDVVQNILHPPRGGDGTGRGPDADRTQAALEVKEADADRTR